MSSLMTCDVKAESLSVRMCLSTYACCVKICMSAFTTNEERVSSVELQTCSTNVRQLLLRRN